MTGKQLYTQLTNFGEIEIEEAKVMSWINTGQREASIDLPVVFTITVLNPVANTVVPITNGVFSIISAVSEDGEYLLTDIEIQSAAIKLLVAADYVTIEYTSISAEYTDMDSELTIHPSLHGPMFYYLLGTYYDTEGEGDSEESGMAERYYQRWAYYRNLAIASLSDANFNSNIRNPISTTDVLPRSYNRRKVESEIYE